MKQDPFFMDFASTLALLIIMAVGTTAFAQQYAIPPAQEEEVQMSSFIDQLRPSFEEDIFGSPLTDGQWLNFKIAIAFLITTADDAQWDVFKARSGQDIDEFQWGFVQALLIAEADAFLTGLDR